MKFDSVPRSPSISLFQKPSLARFPIDCWWSWPTRALKIYIYHVALAAKKNMLIWFRNHAKWWCHLTYRIPLATVLRWFWLQWNSNKPWEDAWDTVQFSIFVHVISTRDRYWNHISYYNKDWPVTWAFKKPGQCCMSNQAPPTRSQLPIPFPSIYEVLVCKFLPFVDLCNVWWPL